MSRDNRARALAPASATAGGQHDPAVVASSPLPAEDHEAAGQDGDDWLSAGLCSRAGGLSLLLFVPPFVSPFVSPSLSLSIPLCLAIPRLEHSVSVPSQ